MRRTVFVLLVIESAAVSSAATLLMSVLSERAHAVPDVVGAPNADRKRLQEMVRKGETLGFITGGEDPEAVNSRLYGLNWSLAPLIVERTANRRFVIEDVRATSNPPAVGSQLRLHVLEDLGNGFVLLRRDP